MPPKRKAKTELTSGSSSKKPRSNKAEAAKMPPKRKATPVFTSGSLSKKTRSYKPEPAQFELTEEEKRNSTFAKPYPQSYSLPLNIVNYVAQNPTNLGDHYNLLRTCKAIFRMSRIVRVREIKCINESASRVVGNNGLKFWVMFAITIDKKSDPTLAATITKRIYRCSLFNLKICHQNLTLNDIQILTTGGNLNNITFNNNIVRNDDDGSIAPFENVFKALFCKCFRNINTSTINIELPEKHHGIMESTARNLVDSDEIKEMKKRKYVYLVNLSKIPDCFNFGVFVVLLKEKDNRYPRPWFKLGFNESISVPFKNQLQKFYDELCDLDRVPQIDFPGKNEESFRKLKERERALYSFCRVRRVRRV